MSGWTDIRDTVEKYLPYAAGAVNPALGAVLGAALGTKPEPDAIKAALQNDPQAAEKLAAYDVQLKTIVANQAVADHQADVADRQSARQLAMTKGFWPQIMLTLVFNAGYFTIMYVLFTRVLDMPPAQSALVSSFLGVLTGQVLQQGNFWFGSSHGSQKKDMR